MVNKDSQKANFNLTETGNNQSAWTARIPAAERHYNPRLANWWRG